jgi:hypothetical protein
MKHDQAQGHKAGQSRAYLDEYERTKGNPGEPEAMPLIWEVLERYPKVKAELERVKGIRDMDDEEAIPYLLEIVDNYPQ